MTHTTEKNVLNENSKEVWECKHILNDFSWLIKNGESIAIGKISNPDDAELIVKAVNDRNKLIQALKTIAECEGNKLDGKDAAGFIRIAKLALNG